MKNWIIGIGAVLVFLALFLGIRFFSEESQNKALRYFQSSVGYTYGKVDILAGQPKPVMSWLRVEKLTSAEATQGDGSRNYRYGFGYFDTNMNGGLDADEKERGKEYFEIGNYTMHVYRDAKSDPLENKGQ